MNSYTPNLQLALPATSDRGWGATLNGDLAILDGVASLGGLAVATAETPSASLNLRVAAGSFRSSAGPMVSFAGIASVSVPASAVTLLWLTDSGTLAQGSALPTTAPVAPLASISAGPSTILSVTDLRVTAGSVGFPSLPVRTVAANYTLGPGDSVLRLNVGSGAFTVTLPSASTCPGRLVRVKKTDASPNAATIAASTGSIDGSTLGLSVQYASKTLIADATSNTWMVF